MLRKQWLVLSSLTVITILASAVIILAEFGTFGNAQGQGNLTQGNVTVGNVTLTPQQKDAICNPNNPASKLNPVNTTESKICGIPVTIKPSTSNATSSGTNMTTGGEAPPSSTSPPPPATSIAPEAAPPSE
ncbi:MAG: hypothetical protein ACJ73C_13390 [Nitrososphaeraceae archaeon]